MLGDFCTAWMEQHHTLTRQERGSPDLICSKSTKLVCNCGSDCTFRDSAAGANLHLGYSRHELTHGQGSSKHFKSLSQTDCLGKSICVHLEIDAGGNFFFFLIFTRHEYQGEFLLCSTPVWAFFISLWLCPSRNVPAVPQLSAGFGNAGADNCPLPSSAAAPCKMMDSPPPRL